MGIPKKTKFFLKKVLTNAPGCGIVYSESKEKEIIKMFEKVMFAVVLVVALVATILVAWGLVVDFCFLGLCFIPLVVGFWVIVVLFYQCYLG